jgi:aryl-alcohol dehydrogenase-like predicted oxidoreductase
LADDELNQLQSQIAELEERAKSHCQCDRTIGSDPDIAAQAVPMLLPGFASCCHYERPKDGYCRPVPSEFYNIAHDVLISRIGIGTYRGAMSDAIDALYTEAIHAAINGGVNLIDTSLNYRRQRSERAVARGLRLFLEQSGGRRDEIVVCTKGGYILPEAITPGALDLDEVVDGVHSMAPTFLADQIHRSRRNLGLETIDVYYLHNPGIQLKALNKWRFMARISAAFEHLERAVSDGFIRYYGIATWEGFREDGLSLQALAIAAMKIAGEKHHFRFVQLPFSIGMREALTDRVDHVRTVLELAAELGISVIASSTLLQGRLSRDLPDVIAHVFQGLSTDAQRAIQFARSTPGIASALVGMANISHVTENLAVAKVPALTHAEHQQICLTLSEVLGRRC